MMATAVSHTLAHTPTNPAGMKNIPYSIASSSHIVVSRSVSHALDGVQVEPRLAAELLEHRSVLAAAADPEPDDAVVEVLEADVGGGGSGGEFVDHGELLRKL